jgi:hypothetical protein
MTEWLKRGDIVRYKGDLVCRVAAVLASHRKFLDVRLEFLSTDFWTTTEFITMATDAEAMLYKLENA